MKDHEIKDSDLVFIRPNLAIEALVDNWYAWAHLISPATAALNIRGRHLKIINSYIKNPRVHAAAIKTPEMLGGPFIDYDGKRVEEIETLKKNTLEQCADLLEFCEAIDALNELLKNEAKGYSLTPLYDKIPEALKGYVELFYDLNNNPSFRLYEPLLYKSKYYKESLQSINLFLVKDDDARSFALSTPKLESDAVVRINIPFKSLKIDELFEMASQPKQFGFIKNVFNISPPQEELFMSFFTTEAPPAYERYQGDGMLTRYFGHASILVETQATTILVDPVISYGYESDISRYTFSDLPDEIDYLLITHNHQDHVLFETLLRIRHKVKHIVVPKGNSGALQDPSLKLMLRQIGFKDIIELEEMETLNFKDCSITGIPFLGEHSDLDVRSKLCHLVSFKDGYKTMFAADSCNIQPRIYEKIHEIIGDIDVIFMGMECEGAPLSWLYGPLMSTTLERDKDGSRRLAGCDYEQTKALIEVFNPSTVFVYGMGLEPWLRYISSVKYSDESKAIIESNKILAYCKANNIDAERLFGEKIIEYNQETQLV